MTDFPIRSLRHLTSVHRDHGLEDVGNPFATGLADIPDSMGYALAAVTTDGGTLCERCVADPSNPVHIDPSDNDGWGVVGWTHSGETDDPDYCDHCGREWTGHED